MSGLFKTFKMDTDKETNGVEIQYPANENGSLPTFRIARISPSNIRYAQALERATLPYKRQIQLETLDKKTDRHIAMKVFVETILLGWDNVQDADGQGIQFTAENAMSLFEQLPDLYTDLNAHAQNAAMFRLATMESDAKNS